MKKAGWGRPAALAAGVLALISWWPQMSDDGRMALAGLVLAAGAITFASRAAWPGPGAGWRRWMLQVFAVLGFAWTLVIHVPVGRWLSRPLLLPPAAGNAEAVVVLASGMTFQGEPGFAGYQRVLHGAKLYREGRAPRLLISTGVPVSNDTPYREKYWVASLLGVLELANDRTVEIFDEGTTTRTEGLMFLRHLSPRGIKRILLVTNGPHVRRACRVFERVGFEVLPAPVQDHRTIDGADSRLGLFGYAMHEWLGLLLYWLRGDIERF